MNPLSKAYHMLRLLGPRVIALRAGVYWNKASGRTRRVFRPRPWETFSLAELTVPGTPVDPAEYARFKRQQAPPFLFPLGSPPVIPDEVRKARHDRQPPLTERLALIEQDRCVYFFRTPSPSPVDWYHNPIDDLRSPPEKHWYEIPDYMPTQGDMRMMWEPSRAAWAIDLARARPHGHAIDAGRLLWRWVDAWMSACPPFLGFQWKCGQESSIRLLAIMIGAWSLANDPATTPQRWVQLARLAWATGYRVLHHIDYAVSQKNNHALSEAMGLMLIAQLFPELREARRWERVGRRVLAQETLRQTYDDGSYVQQSMNYQRVMLQVCMTGLRLAELAERPLEPRVYERLGRCVEFLFEMTDRHSGRCPNYGNNDGALPLPLNECDFTDFRPALQAAHYLVHRKRLLPPGAWDEDLLWLFGKAALSAPTLPPRWPGSAAFSSGGYYTLHGRESWAMVRCHTWRDRPAHYDQLHVDLWWRGQNVAQDCGTYHYYDPKRRDVERYFKSAKAHNLVEIDGRDPLVLASRYLWLPWPRGRATRFDCAERDHGDPALTPRGAAVGVFEGEHYDYLRRPWRTLVRRALIVLPGDVWVIVDDVLARGERRATLRWHLMDAPFETDAAAARLRLSTPAGSFSLTVAGWPDAPADFAVVRGRDEPGRVQGFAAPYFGERLPIPVAEADFSGRGPQRLISVFAPGEPAIVAMSAADEAHAQDWDICHGETCWRLRLGPCRRAAGALLLRASSSPAAQPID
jgi:hypothetical protein